MAAQAARLIRAALALGALALVALPARAAMTIDEAYASANHRRTPFEASGSALPADASAALSRFFALTDQGVVLRIESMRGASVAPRYAALIAALRAEPFPPSIAAARDEVVAALLLHQRVDEAGSARGARASLPKVPDISTASGKLHSAYGMLMRAYPAATGRQKQAFFDHLCALDYL